MTFLTAGPDQIKFQGSGGGSSTPLFFQKQVHAHLQQIICDPAIIVGIQFVGRIGLFPTIP